MTSFIDDIKIVTDKQTEFVANSQSTNTQTLANYLPNGPLYLAKNIPNTNFRKMLESLALELIRKENALETIADQYYPFLTTTFLEEWESALRIPDDCFSVEGVSVEQRQRQVVAKLAIDKIITKADFIALAAFFGYTISITTGFGAASFPAVFPMVLGGSAKERKFTIIVTFIGIAPTLGFPYTFPFVFPPNNPTNFLECFIRKMVPANVNVIFKTPS